MAQKLFRNKILLAKIESTYGTDATADGSNAILTSELAISPYQGNVVSRNLDRLVLGNEEQINTGPNVEVTFNVELAGAGAAGDTPAFDPILRACGFAATVDAGVSVAYAPISTAFPSCTLVFVHDGDEHVILGALGTVSFNLSRGGLPRMQFRFVGLYQTPTTAGAYTVDTSGFVVPVPVTKANTPTYTLGGTALRAESLNIDMANNVVYRNVVNQESVMITDRAPTGTLVIEADEIATKNWYSDIESHAGATTQALQIVHGTAAGNICQIDAPNTQLSSISKQDSDGLEALSMACQFIPSDTGNDELTFTFK